MEKKDRDDTKKRILKTAIRLFAEYGYAGTSTRMIATEACESVCDFVSL